MPLVGGLVGGSKTAYRYLPNSLTNYPDADALGERRDCDVQLEILDELRASASRSERDAIDELLAELRHEQRAANRHLKKALAHAEREDLETRLRRLSR